MKLRAPLRRPLQSLALSALCLLAAAPSLCVAQTETPQPSDIVPIHETVTDGFRHPGIGLTKEILENARAQVIARRDPWHEGFTRLAAHPDSAKTVTCRNESASKPGWPDLDAFDNKSVEGRLKTDASKAKRQALMYIFTGDEVYRANAMHILCVWSRMDPAKYRNYREAHIHASYPVQDIIQAAELMRYTGARDPQLAWTEADTAAFTENLAVPAIRTFLDGNQWFMNQSGYPLAASMAGDIFTNNAASYAKRVEWFTVNKSAPNKGWAYSIRDLARLVDTHALTGEKVAEPVVQLMEMGRDQAHAGGDVEIFMNVSRMMNAQRTRVHPVTGEISTSPDAVGPYEFLDDRILAAADQFCRFMLGYDTPWIPSPSDIGPDGKVRAIYTRIADNYRGRLRGLDFWDAYYYYTYEKGVDVAKKAPFYHEAFVKRIVSSNTDWLYTPAAATGQAARVAPTEQEPAVVEVELRSSQFDARAVVAEEDGVSFVHVTPSESGTRIAFLSMDTDSKTIALRYRSNAVTEARLSGLARPWLLPDTGGNWRVATYTMSNLERFRDIVYVTLKGSPSARVDLDQLVRKDAEKLPSVAFAAGDADLSIVAYVGAPVALDFAPAAGRDGVVVTGTGLPSGSTLDASAGAFAWRPAQAGEHDFIVTLTAGESITARRVHLSVAPDRKAAVRRIAAVRDPKIPCVSATLAPCKTLLAEIRALPRKTDDATFFTKLVQLKKAFDALEPLTPLLPDGSMDFPKTAVASDIGKSLGLLTDGNDDTFPVHTLAMDFNYVFDFGAGFAVSIDAFAIEGRLNFEDRAGSTALFGSNDGKTWTRLTDTLEKPPTELSRLDVSPKLAGKRFRYLKIEKTRSAGGLFEPSELRLFGQRHEAK